MADTGYGIPKEDHGRVFGKFERGRSPEARHGAGLGAPGDRGQGSREQPMVLGPWSPPTTYAGGETAMMIMPVRNGVEETPSGGPAGGSDPGV